MKTKFEKAQGQHAKLVDVERQYLDRVDDLTAQLSAAESTVGDRAVDAALDGDPTAISTAVDEQTRLRAELEVSERAVAAARARVLEQRYAVWAAEADELETRAGGLDRDAEQLERGTVRLLADLEELQGCAYVPASHRTSGGAVVSDERVQKIPRSEGLRIEATGLRNQAAKLRAQKLRDGTVVEGETLDDLLSGFSLVDDALVPARRELRSWYDRNAPAVLHPPKGHEERDEHRMRPVFVVIVRDGRIDEARSTAERRRTEWNTTRSSAPAS